MEKLNKVVEKINKLPEVFHVAIKVSRMLDNFNVNIQELSQTINLDPALTTQLLKLSNSAHYGFSKEITSINDSVAKLGFKTLKSLIFVAIAQGILNHKIEGYSLEKGELWKNSISCAVYARFIAAKAGYKDPETAFTAGLLRDIGKLVIHEYVGEKQQEILKLVNLNRVPFLEAEEIVMGFNHCVIGGTLAEKWNFPDALTESIKYHHSPQKAIAAGCSDIDLISIIHIADSITNILGTGLGLDGMMYNFELSAYDKLNLGNHYETFEEMISDMVDLNDEVNSMIGTLNAK